MECVIYQERCAYDADPRTLFDPCRVRDWFDVSAKRFNQGQSVRSAQPEPVQKKMLLVNTLCISKV